MTRKARRGSSATTVLLTLGTTLGFSAVVVDLGTDVLARAQVRNSLDAGALGGVAYLDGTASGMTNAETNARALVALNNSLGSAPAVDSVQFGVTTNGVFTASTNAATVNSMKITGNRSGIPAPFGALWGEDTLTARSLSAASQGATGPAGGSNCFLPIAVPSCVMNNTALYETKGWQMSSANQDNAGWADLSGPPNANGIKTQLQASNFCVSASANVGSPVYLQNGTVTTALQEIGNQINASSQTWNSTQWGTLPSQMSGSAVTGGHYGRVIQGPVIVFNDGGVGTCASSTQFNQSKPIWGFVWGVIYDVKTSGNPKTIHMHLDLTHPVKGGNQGGGNGGTLMYTDPPVLVQ